MKKKSSIIAVLFGFLAVNVNGQVQWSLKPAAIQTRWAKQVNPKNVLPEYPRPQLVRRQWTNLNGLWDYAIVDSGIGGVRNYAGKILVPYPVESALSGVRKKLLPSQALWYKRTIGKPVVKPGERVLLHFGAVDFEATVFINGKVAGGHKGGYQNFSFDITDLLHAGDNEIAVKAWDPSNEGPNPAGKQFLDASGIMYTPSSGIWQTVWMETVPAAYIQGISITPDVDRSLIKIKVSSSSNSPVKIEAAGKTITGIANEIITFPVVNAKLWSPDDPYLYDMKITMGADKVKSYFGMRKIEIKKDDKGTERIFLNNTYTYNLGTLDQGFWPDGLYTAPTDAALKFDIEAAKTMGFNTIRKHIKIEPARWYYHCDKLGMLVWQDMVQPGKSKEQFEKECKENITQLYNYPCITTWVLFNEGWGAYDQARLTQWIKALDPSRLVNGHSGASIAKGKVTRPREVFEKSVNSDMTDVHSYPPPAIPPHMEGKAMVLGEFGGIGVTVENHLWDDIAAGWGYGGTVTPAKMIEQYSIMVDTLIALEKRGVSASIYTQPFDVESEQNGIMTYDRSIIKLPLATLQKMHARLWPATKNYLTATKGFSARLVEEPTPYNVRIAEFKAGKRDSLFLRNLTILADMNKDTILFNAISAAYIRQLKNPFVEANMKFIQRFTGRTHHAGFLLVQQNQNKVDEVLGPNAAVNILRNAIFNSELKLYVSGPDANPDWPTLEEKIRSAYGTQGEIMFLKSKYIHHINHKEWAPFATTFDKMLQKHPGEVTDQDLNGFAWAFFENVSDTSLLQMALEWSRKSVQNNVRPHMADTYANLLYKTGNRDEAVTWEEKAIALNPNDATLKDTLEKMKAGVKTWSN